LRLASVIGDDDAFVKLSARISSDSPARIGQFLVERFGKAHVKRDEDDWLVDAEVDRTDARAANRELLTELRRIERKTRLRAEWATASGEVQKFFDYVPKGKRVGEAQAVAKPSRRTR
jgi:hypothetical protein